MEMTLNLQEQPSLLLLGHGQGGQPDPAAGAHPGLLAGGGRLGHTGPTVPTGKVIRQVGYPVDRRAARVEALDLQRQGRRARAPQNVRNVCPV